MYSKSPRLVGESGFLPRLAALYSHVLVALRIGYHFLLVVEAL